MKVLLRLSLAIGVLGAVAAQAGTLFSDNFSMQGTQLNTSEWTTAGGLSIGRTVLTDWTTPGDGQFVVGATGAQLTLDTYDPGNQTAMTPTFLGTQAETLQTFQPTDGQTISFTTDLQIESLAPGAVYSMYLYGANEDEIDIELPVNLLVGGGPYQVELNRFLGGLPDAGYGGLYNLPNGFDPLAEHAWTIQWSQTQITYLVDGVVLGSVNTFVPQSPLAANILTFAPNSNWGAAYNSSLQPSTTSPGTAYTALVTGVDVTETAPEPSTWILLSGALFGVYGLRRRITQKNVAA